MTRRMAVVGALVISLTAAVAADREQVDPDGTTPLHWAVRDGNLAEVRRLLRAGADAKAANRYGSTPLSLAAEIGDAPAIEALLAAGADANGALSNGQTMLMLAARSGNPAALRALLAKGANVNAREGVLGENAVIWAAAANHGEVIALLAAAGADVNARSSRLSYPETEWGDGKSGRFTVLPRGGWTPLMYAARQNARDAIRALIAARADLDAIDPDGTTPLVLAVINAHYDAAALLLEAGANPNVADAQGMTPLYAAVDMHTLDETPGRPAPTQTDTIDSLGLMTRLLEKGANANPRLTSPVLPRVHNPGDSVLGEGATPLMRAMRKADSAATRVLLEHGADPALAMKGGVTAAMIAAGFGGQVRFAEYNPHSGTERDAADCVRLALEHGVRLDAVTDAGQTALHVAAAQRGVEFITFLIQRGANPAARDAQGRTALDVAMGQGGGRGRPATARPEIAALLRRLTTDPEKK